MSSSPTFNVMFVACNKASSDILASFGRVLVNQGLATRQCYGFGQPCSAYTMEIAPRLIQNADALVLGLSEPANMAIDEVSAAKMAIKHGTPIVLFANALGAWSYPWFKKIRRHVRLVLVVNEAEARLARPLFPKSDIIAGGEPTWEEPTNVSLIMEALQRLKK